MTAIKKGIKGDLIIIAVMQIVFLAGGVWLIYKERPRLQVFSVETLFVYTDSDFDSYSFDRNMLKGSILKDIVSTSEDSSLEAAVANDITSATRYDKTLRFRPEVFSDITASTKRNLTKRLHLHEKDEALDCYWVDVESAHYKGKGCFSLSDGLVALETTN